MASYYGNYSQYLGAEKCCSIKTQGPQGPPGPPGPASIGPPGHTGAVGYTGATGQAGSSGTIGQTGSTGYTGMKGDPGTSTNTGSTGPTGYGGNFGGNTVLYRSGTSTNTPPFDPIIDTGFFKLGYITTDKLSDYKFLFFFKLTIKSKFILVT